MICDLFLCTCRFDTMPKLAKKCKPWNWWMPLNHKVSPWSFFKMLWFFPCEGHDSISWDHDLAVKVMCTLIVCFQPYYANDACTDLNGIENNNVSQNGKTAWNENLVAWLVFILPFWYKAKWWWFHCSFNYQLK